MVVITFFVVVAVTQYLARIKGGKVYFDIWLHFDMDTMYLDTKD